MPNVFDFSWIIAIGILIGLSLILTIVSERKFSLITIVIYMTIINGFLVSVDLLPIWLEVVLLLSVIGLTYMNIKSKKEGV